MQVRRLDLSGGYGVRTCTTIVAFTDQEILTKAKKGKWLFKAGAEAAAGNMFDEERLRAIIRTTSQLSAEGICSEVVNKVTEFCGLAPQ